MQTESDTRQRARLFFLELLGSERAFNGWNDEEAAAASAQHFGCLLELLKVVPEIISYHYTHLRRGMKFLLYCYAAFWVLESDIPAANLS